MTQPEMPETPLSTEAYVNTRLEFVRDAVELLKGDRKLDPEKALIQPMQNPDQTRADAGAFEQYFADDEAFRQLNDDEKADFLSQKEAALREIAGRFGIGGEADVKSAANVQIIEGGKPWKVEAELAIADFATTLIFAGSTFRTPGADEKLYMEQKHAGVTDNSVEYDMIRRIVEDQESFVGLESDDVLPFGYEISEEHAFVNQPTRQLIKIGKLDGKQVLLLRVSGERYIDEDDKTKERLRPDSAALLSFISQVLSACGDETSSVGLNTSNTYSSRAIDTVRAGLSHGRSFDVGMYGRQTLADIQGKSVSEPTDIIQIPGELRVAYDKLIQLKQRLADNSGE